MGGRQNGGRGKTKKGKPGTGKQKTTGSRVVVALKRVFSDRGGGRVQIEKK